MTVLSIIASLLSAPVVVALAIFDAELWAGLLPMQARPAAGPIPRTTLLMPAHDEAGGIGRAIAALSDARRAGMEVLVVADNCSDDTASIARAMGVRVVERNDPTRRGKGYALAFGRDQLTEAPPECVIVLDADCEVNPGGLVQLARECVRSDAPVQSSYLLRSRADLPPTTQLSNFAFLLKNLVRQQGMERIGGVGVITGTGFAVPWRDLRDAPLASDDLVEDLTLGVWLTRRRRPPRFVPWITTLSDAVSGRDLVMQRTRWEHGFVTAARRLGGPLIASGVRQRSLSQLWLGLHLCVPPLALLLSGTAAALLTTIVLALCGASWTPAILIVILTGLAMLGVLLNWRLYAPELDLRVLTSIPRYVAMKLPIYRRLLGAGPSQWRRTRRSGEDVTAERY